MRLPSVDTGSWFDQNFPCRCFIFSFETSSAKGYNQEQRRQTQDWPSAAVHKFLQISTTYSIQNPERSSWQHLFMETKIVIYGINKTNVNKNSNHNKQSKKNKDSKQSKQNERNKQQADYEHGMGRGLTYWK